MTPQGVGQSARVSPKTSPEGKYAWPESIVFVVDDPAQYCVRFNVIVDAATTATLSTAGKGSKSSLLPWKRPSISPYNESVGVHSTGVIAIHDVAEGQVKVLARLPHTHHRLCR